MGRWTWCGLLALLFAFLAPCLGQAADSQAFHAQLAVPQGREGDVADLILSYDGGLGPVGAFLLRVDYDPARFQFIRTHISDPLEGSYTTTLSQGEGTVSFVYTQRDAGSCLEEPGELLFFRFQVREGAPAGPAGFAVSVAQAVTPQADPLDGDSALSAAFQILAPPGTDAFLLSLEPSVGWLDQPFTSSQLFYTMSVPHDVTSLAFKAQPAEGATCWVNRKNLGAQGSDTDFTITVTAEDGKTKQVYTVTVHREEEEPPSADASLVSLAPVSGQLEQPFSPERLSYTMSVPYDVTTVAFTAEAAPGASYRVNRKNLGAQGSDTDFTITVTAEDGKTKRVYTVTVHREEEDPPSADASLVSLAPVSGQLEQPFSPERLSYTMSVPYDVTTMAFTAEAASGASYRVNRKNLGAQGSDTDFTITVTAEDGKTKQVYTVTVHREEEDPPSADASLLSLTPVSGQLEQPFSPERLVYTMSVPYDVTTVAFTAKAAPGASYRVNRKNLGAQGSDTDFTITVTAEDGKTKRVYTITVHREEEAPPSADASLLSLTPVSGQLEQPFSPERLSYTMSVPYDVTTMAFTAKAAPGASYRVNRKNLGAQGSDTDFTITVTAEDGKTKRVYTVTVHREEEDPPSADASLLSLAPVSGQLEQPFSPERLVYTMSVPYDVTAVAFTAKAAPGASYRVNRKNLGAQGSDTDFTITVTAEDGKTKQAYTVSVYRGERPLSSAVAVLASPKPAATPKPSPAPKADAVPASSPTPEPKAEEIPVWQGNGTGALELPEGPAPSQGPSPAPVLIIQTGGGSLAYVLAAGFFLLVVYSSGPLAGLLIKLLDRKGRK